MKNNNLQSRTILLVSAVSYFLSMGIGSLGNEILSSALALFGLIALIMGVIAYIQENKKEKVVKK